MSTTFTCPFCGASRATLRDLLTCHPRELRAATGAMLTPGVGLSLVQLIAPTRPAPFPRPVRAALFGPDQAAALDGARDGAA